MGCGSSKNDVITGNSFIRKNSSARSKRFDQAAANAARSSAEAVTRLGKLAVMKDIVENNELKDGNVIDNLSPLDADTAKKITREPSERYFSSRKDESVDAVVSEGSEYFSPSPEPVLLCEKTNDEAGRRSILGYVNGSSKTNEWMRRDTNDKNVEELPKEDGATILATGRDFSLVLLETENLKEQEAEDMKEPILVEIAEVEVPAKEY